MRFVISTGAVDRDGDTIDPKGWDLTAYRRNPTVLLATTITTFRRLRRMVHIAVEGNPARAGGRRRVRPGGYPSVRRAGVPNLVKARVPEGH